MVPGICKLKSLEKTGLWGRGQSPHASVEQSSAFFFNKKAIFGTFKGD